MDRNYSIKSIMLLDFISITEIARAVPFSRSPAKANNYLFTSNLQTSPQIDCKPGCASNCSSTNEEMLRCNGRLGSRLRLNPRGGMRGATLVFKNRARSLILARSRSFDTAGLPGQAGNHNLPVHW
jgi:hypothetical protein